MRKGNLLFPLFLVLFALFGAASASGQTPGFTKELQFAQYLQDKDAGKEAMYVLTQIDTVSLSAGEKDSLFYMLGWLAYTAKQLDKSAYYLLRVSPEFSRYQKSRFFAAYCQTFLGRRDSAAGTLQTVPLLTGDSVERELREVQLAGISLLKRDYKAYQSHQASFTGSSYVFAKEEQHMRGYYDKLTGFKKKSPVLAGIYSAILPGAGKFYAGKKKQGIAAFLPVISLAALTYEAYRKDGVRSARFITFGSIFSIFYIGNIWGSTLAVKIRKNEFDKEYDNKILFDMHIPLRNFFN